MRTLFVAKHNFKDLLKRKQILNVSYVKRNIIQKITAISYYVELDIALMCCRAKILNLIRKTTFLTSPYLIDKTFQTFRVRNIKTITPIPPNYVHQFPSVVLWSKRREGKLLSPKEHLFQAKREKVGITCCERYAHW